jgi:hypothetical protein
MERRKEGENEEGKVDNKKRSISDFPTDLG